MADKSILPEEDLVDLEIYYNQKNIFNSLKKPLAEYWQSFLLLFSFIDALVANRKGIWSKPNGILWVLIFCLGITFIYHTYGLGLRWKITGHAPWSNGYEALLLLGEVCLLVCFLFETLKLR